jgi:hypothetical protein
MKTFIFIFAVFAASHTSNTVYSQAQVKTSFNLDVISNLIEDSLEVLLDHPLSKSTNHVREVVNYLSTGEMGILVSNYTKITLDDLTLEEVSPQSIAQALLDGIKSNNRINQLNPDLFNVVHVEFQAKNFVVVSLENSDKLRPQSIGELNDLHSFNQALFESALISEMEQQFPMLKMDTSLLFVVRATSQKDAGYPECYVMKKGGMVNLEDDELLQANRIVREYKRHITEDLNFDVASLIRCNFTDYCVTTVLQYGGLMRYGIVIDNNFKREDLLWMSVEMDDELKTFNIEDDEK